MADLEIEMNEIRNNSLAYKFNKASAFARVNDDIMDKVKSLTPKYDTCQKNLSACDDLFNEADDYEANINEPYKEFRENIRYSKERIR